MIKYSLDLPFHKTISNGTKGDVNFLLYVCTLSEVKGTLKNMKRIIIILLCLVFLSGCNENPKEENKQKKALKKSTEEPTTGKAVNPTGKLVMGEFTYNSVEDYLKKNELIIRGRISSIKIGKLENKIYEKLGTQYYAWLKIEIEEVYKGVEKETVFDLEVTGYSSEKEIYEYYQKDLSYIFLLNYLQQSKQWVGISWELGNTSGITESRWPQLSAKEVLNAAENIKKEENQ